MGVSTSRWTQSGRDATPSYYCLSKELSGVKNKNKRDLDLRFCYEAARQPHIESYETTSPANNTPHLDRH